jgi:hypothetical protein
MTTIEAIKAVRDDHECCDPDDCRTCGVITAAESEAKREAEAKTMAGVAWEHYRLANPCPLAEQACNDLDAYFATGEKEG